MAIKGWIRNTIFLAIFIAISVMGLSFAPVSVAQPQSNVSTFPAQRSSSACKGAAATWTKGCSFTGNKLRQSTAAAAKDRPNVYGDNCWNFPPRFNKRIICKYGAKKPKLRIAVIGNSHAGHWVPALLPLLKKNKSWRVDTFLLSSCYTVNARINVAENSATAITPEECRKASIWSVNSVLKGKYDLAIMSNRTATAPLTSVPTNRQAATAQAHYKRVLNSLHKGGIRTLIIRDTPHQQSRSPECIRNNPSNWNHCSTANSRALEVDPLARAASVHSSPIIRLFDPTASMCSAGSCPAVIGGLIARFDNSHMTHSFAQTFSPRLGSWIKTTLNSGPGIHMKQLRVKNVAKNGSRHAISHITNSGNSRAKLTRLRIKGTGFKIMKSSTCKPTKNLKSKSKCQIRVRFSPKTKGTKKAVLSVSYKLGSRTITNSVRVTGKGI